MRKTERERLSSGQIERDRLGRRGWCETEREEEREGKRGTEKEREEKGERETGREREWRG